MTGNTPNEVRPPRRSFAVANAYAPAPTTPETCTDVPIVVAKTPSVPSQHQRGKKRKELAGNHGGGGGELYDEETVKVLIASMPHVGYGKKNDEFKNLQALFQAAVDYAATHFNVKRGVHAWMKKFTRMKKEYSTYIAKVKQSGRDGDDEGLYNKPAFFNLVHELERDRARHDPPATMSTALLADGAASGSTMTSTRKRAKREFAFTLEEVENRMEQRHKETLEEIRQGNEHKAEFNKMFAKLIEKF